MAAKKDQPHIWRKSTEVAVGDTIRMIATLKPQEYRTVQQIIDNGRTVQFLGFDGFQYTATKNEYVLGRY